MIEPHLLVLAGGFGTRLSPLGLEVPKPLVPVLGQPFLRYLIENWVLQGVKNFTFLLHHRAYLVTEFLEEERSASLLGCKVETVIEPEPLGTGGSIANFVHESSLESSFLVANGDTWLNTGIQDLANSKPASVGLVEVPSSSRYGAVIVDGKIIVSFDEKKMLKTGCFINAGLYHLETTMFEEWDGHPFSLERKLFPDLCREGILEGVRLNEQEFIDIGISDDYLQFCRRQEELLRR